MIAAISTQRRSCFVSTKEMSDNALETASARSDCNDAEQPGLSTSANAAAETCAQQPSITPHECCVSRTCRCAAARSACRPCRHGATSLGSECTWTSGAVTSCFRKATTVASLGDLAQVSPPQLRISTVSLTRPTGNVSWGFLTPCRVGKRDRSCRAWSTSVAYAESPQRSTSVEYAACAVAWAAVPPATFEKTLAARPDAIKSPSASWKAAHAAETTAQRPALDGPAASRTSRSRKSLASSRSTRPAAIAFSSPDVARRCETFAARVFRGPSAPARPRPTAETVESSLALAAAASHVSSGAGFEVDAMREVYFCMREVYFCAASAARSSSETRSAASTASSAPSALRRVWISGRSARRKRAARFGAASSGSKPSTSERVARRTTAKKYATASEAP
mmetsp:Transcript_4396/g.15520  ORF Transcript_4396/g.15520 Transcript_4396/m.15520 type:complete len:396 (+) Transcript_4396:419-1606(+)